jgi:hypothetical protein
MATFGAFSAAGEWFRGNCHTHTLLSDGKASAARIARAYRREGYDFVVLTDHGKAQESVAGLGACPERSRRDDRFLVLNGIEMHPPTTGRVGEKSHHIVGIGVEETPPPEWVKKETAESVIGWIERGGGIAVYGHPYWSGHDLSVMREGRGAFGMEAFNSVCETTRGIGDSSAHLDQALSAGFRWTVFAVDDTHRPARDAFSGWIMVKAKELSPAAILGAIRRRHFYATQGPVIRSLRVRRGIATAVCSPVVKLVWHAEGPNGLAVIAKRGLRTRGKYPLKRAAGRSKYLRLEITDSIGRKAWSNPIWYDARTRRWGD